VKTGEARAPYSMFTWKFLLLSWRSILPCRNLLKMEKSPYFQSNSKEVPPLGVGGRKRSHIKVGYTPEDTVATDVKLFGFENDVKPSVHVKAEDGHNIKVEVDHLLDSKDSTSVRSITGNSKLETEKKAVNILAKNEAWEPINWRDQLRGIEEMRKDRDAPVDTMGCERCHDHDALPHIQRFQILVSLMLSSQTRDEVTSAAMTRLKQHGLTPTSLINMPDNVLGELIKPVGFWRKKIVYLKKATTLIIEKYEGDIPKTVEELCKLPGVGPKMAYLTVQCAWGVNVGIGVDTHVHRISQRLGWLQRESKNPEETRKGLEKWLPQDQWGEINALLVGFGQQICTPVGPHCHNCLIRSICPFGSSQSTSPRKSPSKKRTAVVAAIKKEEAS